MRVLSLLLLMILPLGACRSARPPQQPAVPLTVRLAGSPDLNGGNAAFIHVFQLSDNASFRSAPYEAFWQSPDQALGGSMLSANQVQLFPSSMEELRLELSPDVRFIGVAANLRDPDPDRWRTVYSVDDLRGNNLQVTIGSDSVSSEVQ